jgi:ribosomal protein L40E
MGMFDGVLDTILKRTKDNLTYKAGDAATDVVVKGAKKGVDATQKKGAPKMLEKCPKCKAKLEPDAKFCPECGFKLIVTCEKCNIEYPIGTKFCKQCGGELK